MKQRAWPLVIALIVSPLLVSGSTKGPAQYRVTAAQAILSAAKAINNPEWQIAFLSNTGVTETMLAPEFTEGSEALMAPDGSAGQWVIEYFKDRPTEVKEKGRRGMSYPFHRVVVTAKKGLASPEEELVVPTKLYTLKPEYIAALDDARKLAISKCKVKFDYMLVRSAVEKNGETSWKFRFFRANGALPATVLDI